MSITKAIEYARETAGGGAQAYWKNCRSETEAVKRMPVNTEPGDREGYLPCQNPSDHAWVWLKPVKNWRANSEAGAGACIEVAVENLVYGQRITDGSHVVADFASIERTLAERKVRAEQIKSARSLEEKRRTLVIERAPLPAAPVEK